MAPSPFFCLDDDDDPQEGGLELSIDLCDELFNEGWVPSDHADHLSLLQQHNALNVATGPSPDD